MKRWYLIVLLIPAVDQAADTWTPTQSTYSAKVDWVANHWPLAELANVPNQSETLSLTALATTDDDGYIGAAQHMMVKAPLKRIAEFLESFPNYVGYYNGLKAAKILATKNVDGKSFTEVAFEQNIPIPLVSNDKSTMLYSVWSPSATLRIFRYQLLEGNHLIANDGVIVLEEISPGLTRYFELDFWNAPWGVAKALGLATLWKHNLEGLVQSDLAIKLYAENPEWSAEKVLEESKNLADNYPIEQRYRERRNAQEWIKTQGLSN